MLLLLISCTRTTPPTEPTEPVAPIAPITSETPAAPSPPEGACPEEQGDSGPRSVTAHPIPGGEVLAVVCRFYAYQGSFEYWLARDGADPVRLLADFGLDTFDAESLELVNFQKARGPGDCGDWWRYRIEGDALVTLEHRARGCEEELPDDGELPPPSEWPLAGE
jgi:hypothetical protein